MATHHNYLAVSGRIPGDDEDTMLFYEHTTREDAVRSFADELYDRFPSPDRARLRQEMTERHATEHGVYVNAVLASDSPIREVE